MLLKKRQGLMSLLLVIVLMFTQLTSAFAVSTGVVQPKRKEIKNIIILIPDGMSSEGVTLARWYKSYNAQNGTVNPNVSLALDEMASGTVRTYWRNNKGIGPITDSAPAGTALATGNKTNDKFVGVTPDSIPVASILEAANQIGKATGIVATSNIQHATPAAFSSHYNNRGKYDILAEQQAYNGLDVVLGGGSMYLESPYRKDGENIITEIKGMGYNYVTTRDQMSSVTSGKLWGMFAEDAMAYDMDKTATANTQPTLAEMTTKAIELLSKDQDGFFLMVEGSKVDWAAHANDPVGVISEVLAFDDAVKVALDFAKKDQNTLVLAMTDHGNGGITIGSSATTSTYSSDPLSKYIATLKRATLTGEGIAAMLNADRSNIKEVMSKYYGISDLTAEEVAAIKAADAKSMNYTVGPMISKRANIGWTTGGHTGGDVTLYSYLPGDYRVVGTLDNTSIAKYCAQAWNIDLNKTSARLYVDAKSAFEAKGATVTVNTDVQSGGVMTVKKGNVTITIQENKNFVTVGNEKVAFSSVVVNQDGKFYVPQTVVDLLK